MRRKICATKNQKIVQDGFAALLRACKSREDGRPTDGPSSRPTRAKTNRVAAPSLSLPALYHRLPGPDECGRGGSDRKSTRLNSSHGYISYAVFCLKKKKTLHYSALASTTIVMRAVSSGRSSI